MFRDELQRLATGLSIPYPQKRYFLLEMAADMNSALEELVVSGISESDAKCMVIQRYNLDFSDQNELASVHKSSVEKILERVPDDFRLIAEDVWRFVFLLILLNFLIMEVQMFEFLAAGGWSAQILILVVSLSGLWILLGQFFRWFVKKDHSEESLENNSRMPIYLASISFLIGCLGTAIGYYVVFTKWANGVLTEEQLRIGLSEPLSCAIVGAGFATILVAGHMLIQSRLKSIGVPRDFLAAG